MPAAENEIEDNNNVHQAILRHTPRILNDFNDRPLRIEQISPLVESVPPKMYGGTERIVHFLTEELIRLGHKVTLFASSDSETSAELVTDPHWKSFREHPSDPVLPYVWMTEQVRRRAHEFDIIHGHSEVFFFLLNQFADRSLCTLHGLLAFPHIATFFESFPEVPLISISNDQRRHLETKGNFIGTVYHGIPAKMLAYKEHSEGNYLAFTGRIAEVKRPDLAIEIAVQTGVPLKIAAKVDAADQAYWEQQIQPLIERHSDLVDYIGEIDDHAKAEFLGNARALLFPIDWPEPFGLVMIEAMTCGTPVIARRNGSVPEVIDDGVTGFIVDSQEAACQAVHRLVELDRATIRRVFESRFTSKKMAQNYLQIYKQILKRRQVAEADDDEDEEANH